MKKSILIILIIGFISCSSSPSFEGTWKSDMGPNFGQPSTMQITKKKGDKYTIILDGKKINATLKENGELGFGAVSLSFQGDDKIVLDAYGSVYKRQ